MTRRGALRLKTRKPAPRWALNGPGPSSAAAVIKCSPGPSPGRRPRPLALLRGSICPTISSPRPDVQAVQAAPRSWTCATHERGAACRERLGCRSSRVLRRTDLGGGGGRRLRATCLRGCTGARPDSAILVIPHDGGRFRPGRRGRGPALRCGAHCAAGPSRRSPILRCSRPGPPEVYCSAVRRTVRTPLTGSRAAT